MTKTVGIAVPFGEQPLYRLCKPLKGLRRNNAGTKRCFVSNGGMKSLGGKVEKSSIVLSGLYGKEWM